MNLLYVTPRYPPHTGGVETHVRELAERFAERGHEVTVVSTDAGTEVDGERLPRRERRNGVEIRRLRAFAPGGAFHVAPRVAAVVRAADAELIHAHNYHSLPVFFAAVGAGDRPFVVTPHYHGASASWRRDVLLRAYRLPGGWALRRANAVLAVSEWERRRLSEDFGVDADVVPNGIDVRRFRNAVVPSRARPYLLCVGRLEEYKGVQRVIRCLPRLPEYDLLVAGTGPYERELRELASDLDLTDRVDFLGYVSDERLPGLYAGADVYLTMSSFEAFGLTVAEALAAGTPCVVRPAGALVDWSEYEGTVVAEDDIPSAVREARTTSPNPSELQSWDDVVSSVEECYRALLG